MYTYANWPYYYASGLSAVNAIGTQLRDQISSGLTRKRLALWMEREEARPVIVRTEQFQPDLVWRMGGLARDGAAKPVSRDQFLWRERGQENKK